MTNARSPKSFDNKMLKHFGKILVFRFSKGHHFVFGLMKVAAETSWAGSSAKDVLHKSIHEKHKASLENLKGSNTIQTQINPQFSVFKSVCFFSTFKLQNLKSLYSIESHKHKTNLVFSGAESVPAKRHCPL